MRARSILRVSRCEERIAPATFAVGSELLVNNFTTNLQERPALAMDADGDFIVVWRSYGSSGTDVLDPSIQARRFSAAGVALGSQFQVNTTTTGFQNNPAVAMDSDGDCLVVWDSPDGSGTGIFAQRYNGAGVAVGGEFRVNTVTSLNQNFPAVAMNSTGDAVVSWARDGGGAVGYDIYFQRYDPMGAAVASETLANTFVTGTQKNSSVAIDAGGDFVIAWDGVGISGGDLSSIHAQRVMSTGVLDGAAIIVNDASAGLQRFPSVGVDADGDFVVAWDTEEFDGSFFGIAARRFSSTGAAIGGQFPVNVFTTSSQSDVNVAMDAAGNFIVAWTSGTQDDGAFAGVYARRYDSGGSSPDGEFLVNVGYTTGVQSSPSIGIDADGDFAIAYKSSRPFESDNVYVQRFAPAFRIAATTVNDGSVQRSRVTSLTVTLNALATFAGSVGSAFTLTRAGGGAVSFVATSAARRS